MDVKNIVQSIQEIAIELEKLDYSLEWYLFGSYLLNQHLAKDIDLLIIYKSLDSAQIVRNKLSDLSMQAPLHLIFMHKDEEEELDFIKSQNVIELFSYNYNQT